MKLSSSIIALGAFVSLSLAHPRPYSADTESPELIPRVTHIGPHCEGSNRAIDSDHNEITAVPGKPSVKERVITSHCRSCGLSCPTERHPI